MSQKFLKFVLSFVMAASFMPTSAFAANNSAAGTASETLATDALAANGSTDTTSAASADAPVFNFALTPQTLGGSGKLEPLYSNTSSAGEQEDALSIQREGTRSLDNERSTSYTTREQTLQALREGLSQRSTSFYVDALTPDTVGLSYDSLMEYFNALVDEMDDAGIGFDTYGDYLSCSYSKILFGLDASQNSDGTYTLYGLRVQTTYYASAEEEEELAAKIDEVMSGLNLEGQSDYVKVKAIHDWICANVVYDNEHADDLDYLPQYSAYAAAVKGVAVCQGYATLFYRMCMQEGIGARYITGNNSEHSWNIVQLYGLWYNVDCTWDASNSPTVVHTNFLKSQDDFYGHVRDAAYTTSEFMTAFPMASESLGEPSATALRVAGDTRYDTMSAIATAGFADGSCDAVILATGENFPDALAASSLAGLYKAPVLLTSKDSLSSQAREQIARLGASTVYVLGGTGSINQAVVGELEQLNVQVNRIAGDTRQATSVAVYNQVFSGDNSAETVIIASGKNAAFADALSVSSYSYARNVPIVLTQSDGTLDEESLIAIWSNAQIHNVVLVGGTASVSDTVQDQLGAYNYTRLAGENRYTTSEAIANWEMEQGLSAACIAVATGVNYPDALTGGALCGSQEGILLLADDSNSSQAISVISAQKNKLTTLYVLGGTGSVSQSVAEACEKASAL